MSEKRKFFSKKDIYIIIALLIIPVVFLGIQHFSADRNDLIAVVTVNDKVVERLPLNDYSGSEPVDISLAEYGVNIVLRLHDRQIAFLSSDCRDHICVNTGYLKKENDIAVCLPNKTSVVIYKIMDLKNI